MAALPAVETGVVKSGVLYECVRNGVPFSLLVLSRDDGPLPDTQMDLIKSATGICSSY